MKKLYIDIGSTYFKISADGVLEQHFRNFDKDIYDDLSFKCGDTISKYKKDEIYICSSANGGLSTLIVGLTNSFSLKFTTNIAFNSGINIIDTVLYKNIKDSQPPSEKIDVVIIVGGIDSVKNIFGQDLIDYINQLNFHNIIFVGSQLEVPFLEKNIKNLKVLPNIITNKLHLEEVHLKNYLTNLYQENIIGKEDIKHLYHLTTNQIYSTPYIVNRALPFIHTKLAVVDPFLLIDIGGATTDIHYSHDLNEEHILSDSQYDRLVFKKLGVFKSRESLIFSAKNNEFVYELLAYLNVTENIFDEKSMKATKILMQLSIFLVMYKVSTQHDSYVNLKLMRLKSIALTGGITKVLNYDEIKSIISFFYKKILHYHKTPKIVVDENYEIWTLQR